MPVAIAAANQHAADAGGAVAAVGGNAVDAAAAAALAAALTEPGVCSLAGGAFVTLETADTDPLTIDGYLEMPGRGLDADEFGQAGERVWMDYGGGMETIVGAGSVATPGGLKAIAEAVGRYGSLPWSEVLAPTIQLARDGFPLSSASGSYLVFAGEPIYGKDPRSRAVLFDENRVKGAGDSVVLADLASFLEALADEGVDLFYRGEAGALVSDHVRGLGGILTRTDLSDYETVWRKPLVTNVHGRMVATNPGPAVGGAALTAVLELSKGWVDGGFTAEAAGRFAAAQEAVFAYRRDNLAHADVPDVGELLRRARTGDVRALGTSPSTVHVSTADTDGNAVAITFSAGYGSGIMPPGTGLWLNNSLGEIELNAAGFHHLAPGTRLTSNMAPTVVRGEHTVMAIGSPGADRITSAIAATLLAHLDAGMGLEQSIEHPRLHVELTEDGPQVALEDGMPYDGPLPVRRFDEPHMFFGGVSAAESTPDGAIAASDPRRGGGVVIV